MCVCFFDTLNANSETYQHWPTLLPFKPPNLNKWSTYGNHLAIRESKVCYHLDKCRVQSEETGERGREEGYNLDNEQGLALRCY